MPKRKPPPELGVRWFARALDIVRMGPFRSQIEATEAIRLRNGNFPENAFVWPENMYNAQPKNEPR